MPDPSGVRGTCMGAWGAKAAAPSSRWVCRPVPASRSNSGLTGAGRGTGKEQRLTCIRSASTYLKSLLPDAEHTLYAYRHTTTAVPPLRLLLAPGRPQPCRAGDQSLTTRETQPRLKQNDQPSSDLSAPSQKPATSRKSTASQTPVALEARQVSRAHVP